MLDHLADLESDFSAIHRIWIDIDNDEYGGLSSGRFFRMAERIVAYPGVVQALLMAEQQKEHEREHGRPIGPATNGHTPAGGPGFEGVKVIPLTPELAASGMAALGLGGVVDYATSG